MNRHEYTWSPDRWLRWVKEPVPARKFRMVTRQVEIITELASGIAATRVLDAGCGYGRFVGLLLDLFPSAEIIGCDISSSMVKACNDSFRSQGRFTAQVADISRLPFDNETFNFVICSGVLMHVTNERASIKELCRVVAPGGSLLLSFNNLLSPYSIPRIIFNRTIEHGIPKKAFRTPFYFRRQLRNSPMKVTRTLADSILCIDPSFPCMRRRGLYFIPNWVVSFLGHLDRLLSNSPCKYVGLEMFVLARKVGHKARNFGLLF